MIIRTYAAKSSAAISSKSSSRSSSGKFRYWYAFKRNNPTSGISFKIKSSNIGSALINF